MWFKYLSMHERQTEKSLQLVNNTNVTKNTLIEQSVHTVIMCCAISLQVGPALVLCTSLSAPIIYLSARMALVRDVNSHDYHNVIKHTRLDCSIVSIVSMVSIQLHCF